jgi:hypothetical protein
MGLDKFGGTAWGEIPESASSWSKSNDNLKEDCIICFESMEKDLTSLHCKHSFHTKVSKNIYNLKCVQVLNVQHWRLVPCSSKEHFLDEKVGDSITLIVFENTENKILQQCQQTP